MCVYKIVQLLHFQIDIFSNTYISQSKNIQQSILLFLELSLIVANDVSNMMTYIDDGRDKSTYVDVKYW